MNWFLISVSYLLIVWSIAFPAVCESVYYHPETSRRIVLIWAALPLLLMAIPASLPGYTLLWICDRFIRLVYLTVKGILNGLIIFGRPLLRIANLLKV